MEETQHIIVHIRFRLRGRLWYIEVGVCTFTHMAGSSSVSSATTVAAECVPRLRTASTVLTGVGNTPDGAKRNLCTSKPDQRPAHCISCKVPHLSAECNTCLKWHTYPGWRFQSCPSGPAPQPWGQPGGCRYGSSAYSPGRSAEAIGCLCARNSLETERRVWYSEW